MTARHRVGEPAESIAPTPGDYSHPALGKRSPVARFELPGARLVSPNVRQHWGTKRRIEGPILRAFWETTRNVPRPNLPCTIAITRIGPRRLDDDNATGAAKALRDAVAAWLKIDDGDERVTWLVLQKKGDYGVIVEVRS